MVDDLTVISDVSNTLKNFLEKNIDELPSNSAVIDSPHSLQQSSNTSSTIFLYKIEENPFLKNRTRVKQSNDKLGYPPKALDLHYLFTPFASTREKEQIILSKIIRLFHDSPVLRGSNISDSLKEDGNSELKVLQEELTLEQMNQLWSLFTNTPYRLSISFLVTPVYVPSNRIEEVRRIVTKRMDKGVY